MAPNSLSPAYVRLDYSSTYGQHVALMPTKEWLPTSITGTLGSYLAWNGVPVDAEDMIDAMVAALAALHVVTTTFNLATIYTQATPTSPSFPQALKTLAVVGTHGYVGPMMAIQSTLNMRTTAGKPFKISLLDASALNIEMTKIMPFNFPTPVVDLVYQASLLANAWAGRDGTRPGAQLSWTMTESNALRRRYRKG